jgi:hypothetical protein
MGSLHMKIRGQRQCSECGHEWSYFDTGQVACPACGSLKSVGRGERKTHTDSAIELDLSAHQQALDAETDVSMIAEGLTTTLRDYIRQRGFLNGGTLQPPDDTLLSAAELLHAVDVLDRCRHPTDEARLYVTKLLGVANDGHRPTPNSVPTSLTTARGLAYTEVLSTFHQDFTKWITEESSVMDGSVQSVTEMQESDVSIHQLRERLDTHLTRSEALQGDIPVETSERFVIIARKLHHGVVNHDTDALETARMKLNSVSFDSPAAE